MNGLLASHAMWLKSEALHSRRVSFDPEARAVETILVKYEWRATLCNMGIIQCGRTYGHNRNRLLDDHGCSSLFRCSAVMLVKMGVVVA
jgi:hypothetical protein